ncbi:MAG: FAD-dependent oxidoreductase [Melioribacteraceae bacterium]|nr:FAD-dependent oxidoreductase [Melioribacteraceae bacterium]
MIPRKIIVVGGNAAGPSAAAKAKRINPDAEVILFEAGEFISTGTCELPYLISGEIDDHRKIVYFTPESFLKSKGVKVYNKHFVESIDRNSKRVLVKNLNDGTSIEFEYDKLILTTGSVVKKLPVFPDQLKNLFYLKTVSNYLEIKEFMAENNVQNVLIIGGSYIGLEAAEAFVTAGKKVTIIDAMEMPMPNSEVEIQHLVKEVLDKNNVEFIGNAADTEYQFSDDKIVSYKHEGKIKDVDLVLTAVGFRPNVSLAQSSRLELGKFGAIKVDNRCKTSDPNIYAAGDNIEIINKITNRPYYYPIATAAHLYGHVAGANAAGGNETTEGVVTNVAVKIFDKTFVAVGLNSTEAKNLDFQNKSVSAVTYNLVKVMPESQKVFGKIIFNPDNKLILGAAFFGDREVIGYGDLISSFIDNKITADRLAHVNFNYTPPRSPFINLLSILGRKIEQELK